MYANKRNPPLRTSIQTNESGIECMRLCMPVRNCMCSAAESKKSKLSTCSNDKETQSTSSDPSEHSSSAKEEGIPVMSTEGEKNSKDISSDKEQKLSERGDESIASKQTSAHNYEVKEEERDIKSQTEDNESTTRKNTEDLS